VVLTAGHCLYEQGSGYYPDISFNPGQTWETLPGYGLDIYNPVYGEWAAKYWWVTQGWTDGDGGVDWGLVELYPDANGNYPGDYTGTFLAQANITYYPGAHVYPVGYPALGVFADLHEGYGQYYCDTNWEAGDWAYTANTGSNFELYHRCIMTGGASGGPVFVELSDGRWVIGGVANRGYPNKNSVDWMGTSYFDDGIVSFWNALF
jgi:hypothetical protein